jgi:uncharacterized lipoprotein NlpE involved in copper resistance
MNKYLKLTISCIFVITILSLIGCTNKRENTAKAIYLAPKDGGQLTKDDINKYPEVIRVSDFNEFKKLVSKNTAIWIDKDAVDLLDLSWVQKEAGNKIPIVLVGYNNALYSFREKLSCFGIQGPYIDWSKQKYEPGFSIGMLKEKTETSRSVFMKGYETKPDTRQILSLTNMLLEGKFPE